MKKTLYDFLGVSPKASSEEIKAAAHYLAKKYHPAKYPKNSRVAARFKKLKLVYNTLADPQKRAAYDLALTNRRGGDEGEGEGEGESEDDSTPDKSATPDLKKKVEDDSTQKPPQKPPRRYHGPMIPEIEANQQFPNEQQISGLWVGEQIVYRASIHWFGYVIALLFIGTPIYFWFIEPTLLNTLINKYENLPYIKQGLQVFLVVGVLLLLHTLLKHFTSTLMITTHRIIAKFGWLFKKELKITFDQFENINIKQSFLGTLFWFGTIQIIAKKEKNSGEIKIKLSQIALPKRFEKRLMRLVKQSAYHQL